MTEREKIERGVLAVVLGHAVGDALGVPHEFKIRSELEAEPCVSMDGFGTHNVPRGCWSDDTSMSLATMDSIVKTGGIDADDIMRRFVSWYRDGEYTPLGSVFDIGWTCLKAIERYIGGESCDRCGESDEYSNGNGALMRIHPIALYLYYTGQRDEAGAKIIEEVSALTHAHPLSRKASVIYAHILWEILDRRSKNAAAIGLIKGIRHAFANSIGDIEKDVAAAHLMIGVNDKEIESELVEFLYTGIDITGSNKEGGDQRYEGHFTELLNVLLFGYKDIDPQPGGSGYVIDTLNSALYSLTTTDSYRDAVLRAVNLGRDTDTTAAVTGALAGALYGVEAIPDEWLEALISRGDIERQSSLFAGVILEKQDKRP